MVVTAGSLLKRFQPVSECRNETREASFGNMVSPYPGISVLEQTLCVPPGLSKCLTGVKEMALLASCQLIEKPLQTEGQ